jgi:transposase-like protein
VTTTALPRYPYKILDARDQTVRIDGVIRSQAVLIAFGKSWEGRREVLAVELTNRESATSWKELLARLKGRCLSGVEFVGSDKHEGIRRAVSTLLTHPAWRRAAACTSCVARWTTCRARPTTPACRSCSGSTTGAT